MALICSDVERTIRFYQGLLGFPLVELFENRDYKGSTHLFFDLGHDNTLAFFDFPDLALGPYAEVLGGLHHLAISIDQAQWDAARARLEVAGVPTQSRARSRCTSPTPTACASNSSPRISARSTAPRCTDGSHGMANLAIKVTDLEAACAWYDAAGATVTEPIEWENGRRADVQLGVLEPHAVHEGDLRGRLRLPDEGFLHPALFVDDLDAELARHTVLWGPRRSRHLRHPPDRLRRGSGWHAPRVHGAGGGAPG